MKERNFPGARWRKFDFHTHTPASNDFAKKEDFEPEDWLKAFMDEEIDCVAITDHNGGGWIDRLKSKLDELEHSKPTWYRPLYLFPGVEISTSNDAHILAIFGREKIEGDIDGLLGAVGFPSSERGTTNAITDASITQVINKIVERGGIPIPAHASDPKGIFELPPRTLEKVLENKNIFAMEFLKSTPEKHQLYDERKLNWTEVQGSDTHFANHDGFGRFTWVKMDTPSIDGLKLALRDGIASVNVNMQQDPNVPPDYFIEAIEIAKSKYIGRSTPLICQFSPFLNTIIGGRGSGKSTLLEFIRFALERDGDMQETIHGQSQQYFCIGDGNLLLDASKISLFYRKGTTLYRLSWSAKTKTHSFEEKKDDIWVSCKGNIKSFFPAQIYSQREIFEIADDPRALMRIIDTAPEVRLRATDTEYKTLVKRYKEIELQRIDLCERIAQEDQLCAEFNELSRQVNQIEKSGHEEGLRKYAERQQQLHEFRRLEEIWKEMEDEIVEIQNSFVPPDFDEELFGENTDMVASLKATNAKWRSIHGSLLQLRQEAKETVANWELEKNTSSWMRELTADIEHYESLSAQLEHEGIHPDKYTNLLSEQDDARRELRQINKHRSDLKKLDDEQHKVLAQIKDNRLRLSENRRKFLASVLNDKQAIDIKIKHFGEPWEGVEKEIRKILQCSDRFDRDINRLREIYEESGDNKIQNLKNTVNKILNGQETAIDDRFVAHLEKLQQESMTELAIWFPKDHLEVTFGPNNQRIEQGSPGQKTAALLAFILSYGSAPLLLDQPEDDLDNELIYSLIVEQLRNTKSNRQVIVVTHNANIVVNGDAEMVLALKVAGGETHLRPPGSLQEKDVRQAICDILEGGRYALRQRYKRIHLED